VTSRQVNGEKETCTNSAMITVATSGPSFSIPVPKHCEYEQQESRTIRLEKKMAELETNIATQVDLLKEAAQRLAQNGKLCGFEWPGHGQVAIPPDASNKAITCQDVHDKIMPGDQNYKPKLGCMNASGISWGGIAQPLTEPSGNACGW
jgi:hypothetical protein